MSDPIADLSSLDLSHATPAELAEIRDKLTRIEYFKDRRRARDLKSFAESAWKVLEEATPIVWNWHLDLIAEYLQLVRTGKLRRLIINVPPQTTKSRMVSVCFPSWWWSTDPSRRFMCVSYSGGATGLSAQHSGERRRLIESDWYSSIASTPFGWVQNTALQQENDCGGRMIATSPSGTATGKGVHCLILDDLINPKQAESEAERETGINFVDQTLRTRLSDQVHGAIIVVEQRLHERDVTGHLLAKEPGVWTHLSLPMIAEADEEIVYPISGRVHRREKGELLWPERFPDWVCESLKIGVGSRYWCTPGITPILMSDWSEKKIEEVQVGEEVVGYKLGDRSTKAKLIRSKVIAKNETRGFVVKLTTECGREIFCTPDHKWYRRMREPGKAEFLPAAVGSRLHSVYTPPRAILAHARMAKRQRLIENLWSGAMLTEEDGLQKITAIEPVGWMPVYGLETESGNYVAWGFASQNSAQYQQRPTPAEGVIFNPGNWQYYVRDPDKAHDEVRPAPQFDLVGMSVDCAFKESSESDNVAIHVYGCSGPRNYLIEKDTCRRGYAATKASIRAKKARYPRLSVCLIEDKANGSAIIEEMRRTASGMSVIAVEPAGGKTARAWAAQPDQEAGNCYLPEDPEDETSTVLFVEDLAKFRGEGSIPFDDDVDAFTQWVNYRRMHSFGFFDWAEERAKEVLKGRERPLRNANDVADPAAIAKRVSEVSISTAVAGGGSVARVFGEQIKKVSFSGMTKPAVNEKTPKCPNCGNVNLTRRELANGHKVESCGACDWKSD